MKIDRNRLYAAITGDVIASSRLSAAQREALHGAMTDTAASLREAFPRAGLSDVDIFGGDSWQLVVGAPALALRAGLYYRAGLRSRVAAPSFDVRMALAIGTIDFIPDSRVSHGDGEALRLSGRALRALSKGRGMRFLFPESPSEKALDTVVRLIDALASGWSDRQALAVTGALRTWPQEKIARRCWAKPVTQQAVQQHLDRASWSSVEAALDFFEETVAGATAESAGGEQAE
jgi:hypothetical protein